MHSPHTTTVAGGHGASINGIDTGYVLLKRQDDGQMVTVKSPNAPPGSSNHVVPQSQTQPQSLPTIQQAQMQYQHPHQLNSENDTDRKYFRYFINNVKIRFLP